MKGEVNPLGLSRKTSRRVKFILFFLICWTLSNNSSWAVDDDEADIEVVDQTEAVANSSDFDIKYTSPNPNGPVYFAENFDDPDEARKRWFTSKSQKEQEDNVFKYDGEWDFQLPQRVIFNNDRALVLKSKAKHAAIAAKLEQKFEFNDKPLFVQYEVNFQNGLDCGGAYIKLLSHSPKLDLEKFHDKTPYTIMFGPDKCGNDYKLHFIVRHKNPINGTFEEKHAKKPSNRLEENYSDKKPHLYLLKLFPDNTFNILVDGALINSGSLLQDMIPPINPPEEIEDVNDKKPTDWDERETIPDPTAKKPDDWDEDAPRKISDPSASKPEGWKENQEPLIPDQRALKPDDWDDSMDGDWEPPLIANPECEGAPGCGRWVSPEIDNPKFKGKWRAPTIPNPNYKGKWSPRKIRNPDYFEDKEPFKMTAIDAVGIEIWAMTNLILFDNFIITDSETILADWTAATYDLKNKALEKDSEGVISRIISYSNAHPWIWAVYVIVIALPIVLIVTFCCGGSSEKKVDSIRKKTDKPEEDDYQPEPVAGDSDNINDRAQVKEDLEEEDPDNNEEEEESEDDPASAGDIRTGLTESSGGEEDRTTEVGGGDAGTRRRRARARRD